MEEHVSFTNVAATAIFASAALLWHHRTWSVRVVRIWGSHGIAMDSVFRKGWGLPHGRRRVRLGEKLGRTQLNLRWCSLTLDFYGAKPMARKMATPAMSLWLRMVCRTETLKRVAVVSTAIVAGV